MADLSHSFSPVVAVLPVLGCPLALGGGCPFS